MEKRENKVGVALISAVMVYWGVTTVLMKHALIYMSSTTYIMLRFTSAAVLVLILFGKKLYKQRSKRLLWHGMVLGLFQIIPMECTTFAMYFTSASNSVFIGQLSFIMVPLMECIIRKRMPERKLIRTGGFLLFGLIIFSNVLVTGLNIGDMISIISAFFNACSILALKKFTAEDDSTLLGVLQITCASLISLAVWGVNPGTVRWCGGSVSILFFTGVIGTAAAFVILAVGQSKTTSVNAAFLNLIQPVCAMLGAYFIADEMGNIEPITVYKVIGAVIIIGSLIMYLREGSSGEDRFKIKRKGEHKNYENRKTI